MKITLKYIFQTKEYNFMKKLFITVLTLATIISVSSSDLFARGIGLKGAYATMQNDYDDFNYEDTWSFGIYFDMGQFLFNSLRFKPLLDKITLETEDQEIMDVWSFHMDWYWYFMGNGRSTFAPFLGFGPTLIYKDEEVSNDRDDSDAGVDIFAGIAMGISGTPFELTVEARYRFMEIAERNENILQYGLGVLYKF